MYYTSIYCFVFEVNAIKTQCEAATEVVDMAFWKAEEAKNESTSSHNAIKELIEEISGFLEDRGARAQEIEEVNMLFLNYMNYNDP